MIVASRTEARQPSLRERRPIEVLTWPDVNQAQSWTLQPGEVHSATVAVADDPRSLQSAEYETTVLVEGGRLYALAVSVLGDRSEAEDAVQDAMERAWKHWRQLHDPAKRRAWLTTICLRRCFTLRRRLQVIRSDRSLDADDAPRLSVHGGVSDTDLAQALARLSPKQRAVIGLHYMYGYTLDECAPIMGCGRGTVRTHLARALDTLKERLG
jgi:RNA polymerase sigma-70 factor, ECF subfamily